MRTLWFLLLLPLVGCVGFDSGGVYGDRYLVLDGVPMAEIVVADEAPRMTRLAAHDLQLYLHKISGAELPIVHQPSGHETIPIYVGMSAAAAAAGLDDGGLPYGAYRLSSSRDWLAMVGQDRDFTPIEPWNRSNSDWVSGKVHEEWDAITGRKWQNPMSLMYKYYTGPAHEALLPQAERRDPETIHFWAFDEKGSYNAVCDFLRSLGVRWYMPGELGEVIPQLATIPLPRVRDEVHPDFPVRRFSFRYRVQDYETALWASRLGLRDPYEVMIAHGLTTMTHRDEYLAANPSFFSLYNGKRHNQPGQRYNHPCLGSEAFVQETAEWVRTLYDHYQFDNVSVMPYDAYGSICQCELCAGQDTPERGYRGRLSDYVWGFVNRVAREVAKTHPDKTISCCAYGTYYVPPLTIDRLEPNVQLCIVGGRRPFGSPEEIQYAAELRAEWQALTSNPIMIFENYPFTGRGWYLPAYVEGVIGSTLNATKGQSMGEDIWFTPGLRELDEPGFNAFVIYFTARMYWGGRERDVQALMDEYLRLFYGPAEAPMRAMFAHCEANWQRMKQEAEAILPVFTHLEAARQAAPADSVYAERIAVIADFLEPLRLRGNQLAIGRTNVPVQHLGREASGIVIDGKLDDEYWQTVPNYCYGSLRENQTGRQPAFSTHYRMAWGNRGDLYVFVRCTDLPGDPVRIAGERPNDPAMWDGDLIELLLETEQHGTYQIAVNPAGLLADADLQDTGNKWQWKSGAEVATQIGDDYWTVEMRIPVRTSNDDPLLHVTGRKPQSTLPWHFNLGRQRVRDSGTILDAASPTSQPTFHVPRRFAKLYVR